MSDELLLTRAIQFSHGAHRGQVDLVGADYFGHHVLPVMEEVARRGLGMRALIVAALHDVVEDTDIAPSQIGFVFGSEIRDAVIAITRLDGELYFDYIERCRLHGIAREVKLADNAVNTSGLGRLLLTDPDKAISLRERYGKARNLLERP